MKKHCTYCDEKLKKPYFGIGRFCSQSCANRFGRRVKEAREREHYRYDVTIPFTDLGKRERFRLIYKEQKGKCAICRRKKWLGKAIVLEYDHKNGKHHDNRRKNSRLVCPNCHATTKTFRGKNINKHIIAISDKQLLKALRTYQSKRAALLSLGLAGCGGNYLRCYKLLGKQALL